MTAEIIALPGAASSPVVQHPRRGRYPKGVIPPAEFASRASRHTHLQSRLRYMEKINEDSIGNSIRMAESHSCAAAVLRSFIGRKIPADLVVWLDSVVGLPPPWVFGWEPRPLQPVTRRRPRVRQETPRESQSSDEGARHD